MVQITAYSHAASDGSQRLGHQSSSSKWKSCSSGRALGVLALPLEGDVDVVGVARGDRHVWVRGGRGGRPALESRPMRRLGRMRRQHPGSHVAQLMQQRRTQPLPAVQHLAAQLHPRTVPARGWAPSKATQDSCCAPAEAAQRLPIDRLRRGLAFYEVTK